SPYPGPRRRPLPACWRHKDRIRSPWPSIRRSARGAARRCAPPRAHADRARSRRRRASSRRLAFVLPKDRNASPQPFFLLFFALSAFEAFAGFATFFVGFAAFALSAAFPPGFAANLATCLV